MIAVIKYLDFSFIPFLMAPPMACVVTHILWECKSGSFASKRIQPTVYFLHNEHIYFMENDTFSREQVII